MQIEVNREELEEIIGCLEYANAALSFPDLCARLDAALEQMIELDDMDLDDCQGGACKL